MNGRSLFLPALALASAALLLAPVLPTGAFSKTGTSLGEDQRDLRLFDNFLDPSANDNVTPEAMFPGFVGAELAIWKGAVEWGSTLHGDGSGDPVGGNALGSGGASFDAFWAGNASGIGGSGDNIVSALDCGGGGTLAFTDFSTSGWRIRFCDEWVWDDGPGTIPPGSFDIQGVFAHEYGHALGLGHSGVPGATMAPVASAQEALRSIEADDQAGVQCVYGVAAPAKPVITATSADALAGTIAVEGTGFHATANEVWFTSAGATAPGSDPIVRVAGVPSSLGGTRLALAIPAGAGPGDVLVNAPGVGGATLSNAFPTDLAGTISAGAHPDLVAVDPASIEALIPGSAQTITLSGTDLDRATGLLLDGVAIDPARYTIVDAATITLDMPQADGLGAHELGVTDGSVTDVVGVTVVSVSSPRLQWGSGDPFGVVARGDGLDMILAGAPGELHHVRGSPHGPPTLSKLARPVPGQVLLDAGAHVIPAEGWIAVHLAELPDPAVVGATWYAKSFVVAAPRPFAESNDQSITLVP